MPRSQRQDQSLNRARRHLCEHLLPLLDELVAAGHVVCGTALDAWTECDVMVELRDGPTLKELRAHYSWPRGVASGCNKEERTGPVANYLYCNRCKTSIHWPR